MYELLIERSVQEYWLRYLGRLAKNESIGEKIKLDNYISPYAELGAETEQ